MKNIVLDRDISQRKWNSYLKKYQESYVIDSRNGISVIRLKKKLGWIEPYSITKKQLVAVLTFNSGQHKTFFKRKLVGFKGFELQITQEGDYELCIRFNENDMKALEPLFSYYPRKKYSDRQRKQYARNVKQLHKR